MGIRTLLHAPLTATSAVLSVGLLDRHLGREDEGDASSFAGDSVTLTTLASIYVDTLTGEGQVFAKAHTGQPARLEMVVPCPCRSRSSCRGS